MSYDLVLQQSSLIAKNTAHSESRQQEAEPGSSTRSQNRLLPSCSPCSLGAPPAPSVLPLCSLCAPSVLPPAPPVLPPKRPCSLSRSKTAIPNPKFGVYIIYIYIPYVSNSVILILIAVVDIEKICLALMIASERRKLMILRCYP